MFGGLVGRGSEVNGRSMVCSTDVLVAFVSYIVRLEEKLVQDWLGWISG